MGSQTPFGLKYYSLLKHHSIVFELEKYYVINMQWDKSFYLLFGLKQIKLFTFYCKLLLHAGARMCRCPKHLLVTKGITKGD